MGWPKGKKRKVVTTSDSSVQTLESTQRGSTSVGYDLVLGIRRIRAGNFSGLWELSELSVEGEICRAVRIMTDANIKPIVIAQIGKRLNQCF